MEKTVVVYTEHVYYCPKCAERINYEPWDGKTVEHCGETFKVIQETDI